ncbi:MAG: ABC transporter substrate-binding protein [Alphaproteobacteria bacterium]|nr:ABC transporter substrate-binding protein [Alphaproteobacteria bacterium]
MKKILFSVLTALLLTVNAAYAEINAQKAEDFVKNITKQGIEEIINSDVTQAEKDQRFAKLFNEYLDLDFIGRFVLGRYWKTATPKQRSEFITVYRELNIKTWSKRFDEFKGKIFIFNGTTPSSSQNQIFVNSTVPMDQGAPAKVVWRVKETNGQFKVVDIIIENVSLAITARNEYTTYIRKSPDGIDGLINDLKKKSL